MCTPIIQALRDVASSSRRFSVNSHFGFFPNDVSVVLRRTRPHVMSLHVQQLGECRVVLLSTRGARYMSWSIFSRAPVRP